MSHSGQHMQHPLWKGESEQSLQIWKVFTEYFFSSLQVKHEDVSKGVHKQKGG